MNVEIDHEHPGKGTCLNLGIAPDSTIGKIICGQAEAIKAYQVQLELAADVGVRFKVALEAVQKRTGKIYAMGHEEARRAAVDCYELAGAALKPTAK